MAKPFFSFFTGLDSPLFRLDAYLQAILVDFVALLHRPLQSTVEHQVDAVDGGSAQPFVLILSDVYSAALQ